MDAFEKSLKHTFRDQKVHVVSRDGVEYTGFVGQMEHHQRHILLHSAERGTDDAREHIGSVLVSHADTIELANATQHIERISLNEMQSSPYTAREFNREDNLDYIERVRNQGYLGSFPVVRPLRDEHGYEIVEGHKRVWVARCADFESFPVEIQDLSEWEATQRFVADHIPTERHVTDDNQNHNDWYADATIETAIQTLLDYWGDRAQTLHPVAYNIVRLSIDAEQRKSGDQNEMTD